MVFILCVTSEFAKSESQYSHGVRFEVSGTAGNLVRYCEKSVCVCTYNNYSSIDIWLIFAYTVTYYFVCVCVCVFGCIHVCV